MKLNSVKAKRKTEAFTLIEMIGVLAVIAILAAMLIPRVFEAINNARVNNCAVTCETLKAAAADHYGKYGKFDQQYGTNAVAFTTGLATHYDTGVLIPEGLLDKPFSVKIGGGDPSTNCLLELTQTGFDNNKLGYKLDGTNVATAQAQFVLEAVIYGVSSADAKDLNDRIDGAALGTALGTADALGRVEYDTPVNGTTTVYVYLTHR